MNHTGITKVLLIEDDEDDFVLTRKVVSEIKGDRFTLDWAGTYQAGLEMLCLNQHDVALVDYRLGARNGVELLREALEYGCQAPVILLTGAGQHEIDVEAMQAGAADYLVKAELRADSLERSIRYALQRKRAAAQAAFEQARLAAFGAEVGLLLTRGDSLDGILEQCTQAMIQYLNAAAAYILTYDAEKKAFTPRAAGGRLRDCQMPAAEWPQIRLDCGALHEGKPLLIRQLLNDERVPDQEWVKRSGVVSCAAYPLLLEEKLVGLMAVLAERPLTEQIWQEMGSVANGISLYIERKRSAEALAASEEKYRSMVENIKEVIFQMDEFGHWAFLNPAWTAVTGFDVEQALGTFFIEYVHEEDREWNRHIFLRLLEHALEFCRYETRLLTNNGKVRWVEVYAQLALKGDGSPPGISGSLTDITERKLAETAIQKLAAFPQVNPNPVLEFAADGSLTYSNNAARELANSLGKQDLVSILPPHPGGIARTCLATGQKALRQEVCVRGRTVTWSFFPVAVSQVVHCYGADVTEMLNLEAQFRHAQKLESVGQLAAGVAHDFNNILTVIQGYSDSLLDRSERDPATAGPLKQISDAAKRASALTRQLLMFSRKQVIQTRVLDLNAVLRNLANMLLRLLGEDISLQADYCPALPRIEADTGMLEQIVMNLAVNARDAMPKGGKLLIRTAAAEIGEGLASRHADARAGKFVALTVTDTGCGMDRKTLDRLFEPFFSTKEVGKGTGLGLATVYGLVKQHQGWIEVTSELRVGTTFRIYFPVTERTDPLDEPAAPTELIRGGKETVLVVEDEPVLREMVCEILRGYDYQVVEAGSGMEALRVWDEYDGQVDLLLTDMVMPGGMTGRDLAEQLKKRKPGLRVIYSSGYSPEAMEKDTGEHDTAFLPKPYHPPQLARVVRKCLDRRRSPARGLATA
jgi:two-component system, cell cycle sensor histidine kinase and response regulator CckA